MKANNYISKSEHKLLLFFAFIIFVLAFSSFTSQIIENYNKSVSVKQEELKEKANYIKTNEVNFEFYILTRADPRPFYSLFIILLSLFTFLALLKTKKFLLPSFSTSFSFLIFFAWFFYFNNTINNNETQPPNLSTRLLIIATFFDYLVFSLVSILLFWQISILLRMLIKTLQKEKALP